MMNEYAVNILGNGTSNN